jgi:outer membrane protein, heavy metal efflux system
MMLKSLCFFLLPLLAHAAKVEPISLAAVVKSVSSQYPPYLMALIERDIAAGRLRQAQGAFDLNFLSKGSFNPTGFYDGSSADFVFDQPLPFWGGNAFAGYRISSGSLADYDKSRTQVDGELRMGLRLNLLRDGPIDSRRAALWKARLDQEIADPFIQRQRLDIVRTASRAYVNWLAMGLRLGVTENLRRIAQDRDDSIGQLVAAGQLAPIVKVDNERLVLSRELAVVQARRRFEAASIELSLFFRDALGQPIQVTRQHLPTQFPNVELLVKENLGPATKAAYRLRPELRRINLVAQKFGIDEKLAKNGLLPNLDLTATVSEDIGSSPYKDLNQTESMLGLEFKMPLPLNEANGRLEVVKAELARLDNDAKFTRERITAEILDGWSAISAAAEQIGQTRRNVELSEQLERGERERFEKGASDLLALQIREQAAFDARLLEVDARADFFRAKADFEAATAEGLKR